MELTDQASAIRSGEELPAKRIEAFIRDEISGLKGPLAIGQFPGGHSNLTYLITVGDREMVLRRPPHGTKAKSAHDMGREYRMLLALQDVYPYCPRPLAYSEDESIMGCPFYLMERIAGIIIRKDIPAELQMTPGQTRRLFERVLLQLDQQFLFHRFGAKRVALRNNSCSTLDASSNYTLFVGQI